MKKIIVIVFMSLLISIYVVLNHVIPVFQIETIRISFGFLPQAFASMLFGPIIGGIGSAAGDVLGMIVSPRAAYFPGFTLSAMLTGIIYGLFLYKKPKNIWRIILAVLCITIFVDIGLNTYWLTVMYGHGFLAILPARAVKCAVMVPVQAAIISLMWNYAGSHIERMYLKAVA
ncbi:MAG: folate family ECF transporter S component [Acetivibrionales bacterium]|jgi:ECF transporter S component (folate family)